MIDDLFVRTTNLRNLCRIQKAKVLALIRRVPRDDWLVMAWVLASKLLLFLFGIKSFQILEDKYLPTGNSWLEIWNRWDSLIYQRIAQVGYDPNYVWKAWFYPLFPWSVRLAYHFCGDYLTGAFLVSGVSLFIVTLRAAHCLVLSNFSHRVFFAHRLYGKPLSCVCTRFHPGSTAGTVVAGGRSGGRCLGDAR